jgi:hypothetical protein
VACSPPRPSYATSSSGASPGVRAGHSGRASSSSVPPRSRETREPRPPCDDRGPDVLRGPLATAEIRQPVSTPKGGSPRSRGAARGRRRAWSGTYRFAMGAETRRPGRPLGRPGPRKGELRGRATRASAEFPACVQWAGEAVHGYTHGTRQRRRRAGARQARAPQRITTRGYRDPGQRRRRGTRARSYFCAALFLWISARSFAVNFPTFCAFTFARSASGTMASAACSFSAATVT